MAVGATPGYLKYRQTIHAKSAKSGGWGKMKPVEQCEDALYQALAQKEDELQRCGAILDADRELLRQWRVSLTDNQRLATVRRHAEVTIHGT